MKSNSENIKSNKFIIIFLICLVFFSLAIKFYNLEYFASYTSETAQHYLEIIKLNEGKLLLNGALTSHHWLRLSSTPYYLFYPIFAISQFHPLTLSILWLLVSTFTIILNYYVVNKVLGKRTALISSSLYAISPANLLLDRNVGFFNFIIPLLYLLIYVTHKSLYKSSTYIWLVFLIIGLMCTLHAAAIILLPLFIGLFFFYKKYNKQTILQSTIAFLVPQIPFFLIDSFQQFNMTKHMILWIPYKIFNFITGKTLGVGKAAVRDETFVFIFDFLKNHFLPNYFPWWIGIVFGISLIAFLYIKKEHEPFFKILLSLLVFGIFALIIHKNPPIHYFMPIFVVPIILVSYLCNYFLEYKNRKILVSLFLIIITGINLQFIFSSNYLFKKNVINSYATQLRIADFIIKDTKGETFSLKRIGQFDQYAEEFKENYIYLLWWRGNKPAQKAAIQYTIVEDKQRIPVNKPQEIRKEIDGIVIIKQKLQSY